MEDIYKRVYDSSLFHIKKEELLKKGKSKSEILNIIKVNLSNITSENNDLQTIVKSQIIEILKDEFKGDISDIICSIFREYYEKQPPKLNENLTLFKKYCDDNSDVCIEELITSLLMNVETRAIDIVHEEIADFINNKFSNKLWTDYFHRNNCQQEIFDESLKQSKRDIKILSKSYSRLDDLIKNQARTSIEFTTRIVNDKLNTKTKEFEFLLNDFEKNLKNADIEIDEQIEKVVNVSLKKYNNQLEKAVKKINNLEKKISIMEDSNNKEKQSLNDKIKNLQITNEKLKTNIEHITNEINKDKKDLNMKINKQYSIIQELKKKNNNIKKEDFVKLSKFNELSEKYTELSNLNEMKFNKIDDTIKSISNQNVQKDISINQEIDKKIDDKLKFNNNNEIIGQLQREIIELRAQIDLIYRHRSQEIHRSSLQGQIPQLYQGYSMY